MRNTLFVRDITRPLPFYPTASWGEWGSWSQCSASCGSGIQTRSRDCFLSGVETNVEDCDGNSEETMNCEGINCPGENDFSMHILFERHVWFYRIHV